MTAPDDKGYEADPEQLRTCAEELFGKTEEFEAEVSKLHSQSLSAESALSESPFDFVNAFGVAASHWRLVQLAKSVKLVENIGQFLATHAENSIEIDEFSASEFRAHADEDRFDTGSSGSDDMPLDPAGPH